MALEKLFFFKPLFKGGFFLNLTSLFIVERKDWFDIFKITFPTLYLVALQQVVVVVVVVILVLKLSSMAGVEKYLWGPKIVVWSQPPFFKKI